MTLKTCSDCGNDISKRAPTCPYCGAPQKMRTSLFTWLVTIFMGVGFFTFFLTPTEYASPRDSSPTQSATPRQSPQPSTQQSRLDKSPQKQNERKAFIEKLIGQGIFQKVEVPGSLPRLWVKPAFYSLDFATKESFVSVVYAYYFDGTNLGDTVLLFDNQSGKQIGAFSSANPGLELE